MIILKLTNEQAQALHDLLTKMDIESLSMGTSTLNSVSLRLEHPLWSLLDDLRQQLQIQRFRQAKEQLSAEESPKATLLHAL
jgi:hypothetical protein